MDIQPRVLVIDADAVTLRSVATVAEEEGFDVSTALDAAAAIRECRSAYVDLVMIDAGADGRAGADVLNSIRILKPSVRAVFMEGASISEHRFISPSEDAIERVEKPVGVDRLHRLFARLRTQAWHVPDANS